MLMLLRASLLLLTSPSITGIPAVAVVGNVVGFLLLLFTSLLFLFLLASFLLQTFLLFLAM
jgi:hypothetical protein